ncbi:MAG: ATP-binding protein, partial [Nitrospirae bacterium]|nr:ATP-binding protein [Nitrospirota bacterium]
KDSGIGVSNDNIDKIFEPFFSAKQNGLGLGLPIAKRIIEEHGGRIELKSAEGEGTEVRLTLPLSGKDNLYAKSDSAGGCLAAH